MSNTQVILLCEVLKLGSRGEVKSVKRGFAQNYLLKLGLARLATKEALETISKEKEIGKRREQRTRDKGTAALKKISGKTIAIKAKASDSGTLYGGIGQKEIKKFLEKEGYSIPEDAIKISAPFKAAGSHKIEIKIGNETADFILNIGKEL